MELAGRLLNYADGALREMMLVESDTAPNLCLTRTTGLRQAQEEMNSTLSSSGGNVKHNLFGVRNKHSTANPIQIINGTEINEEIQRAKLAQTG